MPTPNRRALVSLAATMAITLALGACLPAARPMPGGRAPMEVAPRAIRFDNDAREHVHVYLIGEKREWLLGRVEPGASAVLRIPEESLGENSGFVRLAVLTGQPATLQAAREARATLTVAQPGSAILSQRWKFSQGELTSLGVGR